jgi:hypothetical protein
MNIKIESGAIVQITDKPIINVFGDVNVKNEKTRSTVDEEYCDFKDVTDVDKNNVETNEKNQNEEKDSKINYVAPKLALQEVLKGKWFDSVVVDKNKYSFIWRQSMVEALMRTKWAKDIAMEWADESKRLQVKFAFIGALKDVGVLNRSYNALASEFKVAGIDSASLAKYMGYGKKKSYFEWLKQYVNQE